MISAIFTLETVKSQFFLYLGISLILLSLKVIFQKLFAIQFGYTAIFDFDYMKKYIIIFSAIFIILPIKLFYTGTIRIENIPELRMGKRSKFPEHTQQGIISYCGIIPLLILLFLANKLPFFTGSTSITIFTKLTYLFVILSILPFPYFDGFNLLYGSRTLYVLYTSLIALILMLIYIGTSVTTTLLTAILIALTITTLYYYSFEIKF